MTLIELREMCAKVCDTHHDKSTTLAGAAKARWCAEDIRAIQLPVEQEPVAFLWVMDNTEGIDENKPLKAFTFNGKENPFGTPGEHYSEKYPVTCTPLYAAPPSFAALEKQVADLKLSLQAAIQTIDTCGIKFSDESMRLARERAK